MITRPLAAGRQWQLKTKSPALGARAVSNL
jgi:hypothetical protein